MSAAPTRRFLPFRLWRYPLHAALRHMKRLDWHHLFVWGLCIPISRTSGIVAGVMRREPGAPFPPIPSPREGVCMKCHASHPVWYADNDLWNATVRRPDGSDEFDFLCPTCFTRLADERGIQTGFRVSRAGPRCDAQWSDSGGTHRCALPHGHVGFHMHGQPLGLVFSDSWGSNAIAKAEGRAAESDGPTIIAAEQMARIDDALRPAGEDACD